MQRKYFILVLFLCTVGYSQNNIKSFEYWFDGNYSDRQKQSVIPTEQMLFNAAISTNGLSDGLHILHLNCRDDSARLSGTLSQFFYKKKSGNSAGSKIDAYQFWFDNQYSTASLQTVIQDASFQLNVPLLAGSISNGLHILHMRVRDINQQWSSPVSQFFYKRAPGESEENKINAYQYWFDNSFELAQLKSIAPNDQLLLSEGLSTAGLAKGLHLLHFRFRDINNQWSTPVSQFVYINDSGTNLQHNVISKMQYWFDSNKDAAVTKPLPGEQIVQLSDMFDAASVSDGLHSLHLRFADSIGQWCSTVSQFFFKSASGGVTTNIITGYRYWFNNDGASKMMVSKTSPQTSIYEMNRSIDLGCLEAGKNSLHLQFKDSKGLWSSATTDTVSVIATIKVYRFTGNGNWSNPNNWSGNMVPALELPGCKEIIIDHVAGGHCMLDVPQILLNGSKLTVLENKKFIIPGEMNILVK